MKGISKMKFVEIDGGVCAAKGYVANGVHCGLRKNKSKFDLAAIYSEKICNAAAVYTQNKVKGAPLAVTKEHIKDGTAKAIIVNSGNANTCNADGEEKAELMCKYLAEQLNIEPTDVAVASTGVIGEILPIEPIKKACPKLVKELNSEEGSEKAATAILTTDTEKKQYAVKFQVGGKTCTIGGMAKGSGMIHPNMATMLCFITSDADIDRDLMQKGLKDVVDDTFNMISIDGDTSTNDMVIFLANGMAENDKIVDETSEDYAVFKEALMQVMTMLSKMIAKDGEGATKLLECTVFNAEDEKTAKVVAKSVITSNLFKCAMFGEDANWGRILCAVGYSDAEFDITKVNVLIESEHGKVVVCENGSGVSFNEDLAKNVLSGEYIKIKIDLQSGVESATAWGCDLTYDYVKINGEYRT